MFLTQSSCSLWIKIPVCRYTVLGVLQVLDPAAGQLVEELLVELLIALLAPHREEDVAADKLVNNFAVSRQALQVINIMEFISASKRSIRRFVITEKALLGPSAG